ncbi:MAG: hypothetical protein QOD69_1372, partial [Solirubrobacteraceae bacterium]|nr:hypothetical protein [Solirubrobacteraceae bacterium]
KPDVVTADINDNALGVLLGRGDGSFDPVVSYGAGSTPFAVAIADVDGDGKPDLAVANYFGDSVSVLLGNGDGSFRAQVEYPTGATPTALTIADVDADGHPDLVTANINDDSVSVLLGRGDGTFAPRAGYPAGSTPVSVGVADLDADGKPDLVVADYFGDAVSVLLGNGDGSFQARAEYATGHTPNAVAVADVNADGKPDVVTANIGGDSASVLEGDGNGTLRPKTDYASGSIPLAVAIADVDADTRPDLLVANNNGNSVSVLLNTTPITVDLHVTKTTSPASAVTAGGAVQWTVTVANEGSGDAGAVTVRDLLPSKATGASWTCAASAGSACAHAGGGGDVTEPGSTVKAGGRITYTIAATVKPDATGSLTNTAGVTPAPPFDTDPSDDSATTAAAIVQPPEPALPPPDTAAAPADPPAAPELSLPAPFAPPQISRLSVDHRCVRAAPAADAHGLSFSFWLSQDATVSYELLRRVHSPRWSSCPRRGGTSPGTLARVSHTRGWETAGQHETTLALPASARTRAQTRARTGLRHVSLLRLAAHRKLAPGTYLLRITATNAAGQASAAPTVKFWVLGPRH